MLKSGGKLLYRLLALSVLLAALAVVSQPGLTVTAQATGCQQCWDGCEAEDMQCDDFCAGCPYDDERYFQSTTGHTINCAGGISECMSNCHYAEMLCYDNCTYSSCGFPNDR